jgi:hypothetical protein
MMATERGPTDLDRPPTPRTHRRGFDPLGPNPVALALPGVTPVGCVKGEYPPRSGAS